MMIRRLLILGLLFCLITQIKSMADELNSIIINENPTVEGKEIYLGDIASIKTNDASILETLRKIHICQSANPGSSVKINISYIKSRARQQGIQIESLVWDCPENITIQTKSQVISTKDIQLYAENFIKEKLMKADAIINIQPTKDLKPIILPYGKMDIKVDSFSRYPINGYYSLRFTFLINGREYGKQIIPFNIEVIKEIVTASKPIEINKIISEDDLTITAKDIGLSFDVFYEKEKLIGKKAKKSIGKDSFITSDMIETPPIIKKGDLIAIVFESSSLKITTQGKAMENGINGQVIRVVNTSSLKELQAQVIDEKTVKVLL